MSQSFLFFRIFVFGVPKQLYRLTACVTIVCIDRSVAQQSFSSINVLPGFYHKTQESTMEDSDSMSGIHH